MNDNQQHFVNLDQLPGLRLISIFFNALSLVIYFGTLGMVVYLMPKYWHRIKHAQSGGEKAYFCMRFAAAWCLLYALTMIIVLAIGINVFHWEMMDWWPTVSFLVIDWSMPHSMSVALDIWFSLVAAGVATFAAARLGSEDAGVHFVQPQRVQANEHIADVMQRYNAVLATDPTLNPSFDTLPSAQKREQTKAYNTRLEDIESRVREVHRIWHKPCPI